MKKEINIKINGESHSMSVDPGETLLELLRETLHLTGTKNGCNRGECGTCTVLLEGRPVRSCILPAVMADGHDVETIEGLQSTTGEPSRIQEAFVRNGAIQCGFCTPGMILTGKSLLEENLDPSESEVRRAISGNLCRCTGYTKIVDAIRSAAKEGS